MVHCFYLGAAVFSCDLFNVIFSSSSLVLVLVGLIFVHNIFYNFVFGWIVLACTSALIPSYLCTRSCLIGHPWRLYSVLLISLTYHYQFCLQTLFVLVFYPVVYFFSLSTRVPKIPLMYCRSFVSYLWLCSRLCRSLKKYIYIFDSMVVNISSGRFILRRLP